MKFQISSYLGCRDDDRVWDAIRKDDDHIIVLLREVLRTRLGQQAVLSLRENSAESFLNLIYKVCRILLADSEISDFYLRSSLKGHILVSSQTGIKTLP